MLASDISLQFISTRENMKLISYEPANHLFLLQLKYLTTRGRKFLDLVFSILIRIFTNRLSRSGLTRARFTTVLSPWTFSYHLHLMKMANNKWTRHETSMQNMRIARLSREVSKTRNIEGMSNHSICLRIRFEKHIMRSCLVAAIRWSGVWPATGRRNYWK